MGFASAWLEEKALFPQLIEADPDASTGIIVVIPAFGEEGLEATLKSLSECEEPPCRCEVIVIINAPKDADGKSIAVNKRTVSLTEACRSNEDCFYRLYYYDAGVSTLPQWGVGYARRMGMDEALRRFDAIDNPGGVIASLDADCSVSHNYFTGLYRQLYCEKNRNACSITLYNGRNEDNIPDYIRQAAERYELSRRYMLLGMRYAGYPWCFNTSGAAMAFRASAYLRAGGMNRRQAGEDFWFIRKLIPQGGFFNTSDIIVYHSARISMRVPFGTGMSVNSMVSSTDSEDKVCDPSVFDDLKSLWEDPGRLFKSAPASIEAFHSSLPDILREFIPEDKFLTATEEISRNTSSPELFARRYYLKFDLLTGQRYINYCMRNFNRAGTMTEACTRLAEMAGIRKTEIASFYSVLSFYRDSEAWISCSPS